MKMFVFNLSLAVAITILRPLACGAQTAPAITTQPASAVVSMGNPAALNAVVSGTGVGFQWLKDGVILPGQTNGSISFGSFQFTNGGNYQLVATNAFGMAITLPASLSVPFQSLAGCGANSWGQLGNASYTQQMFSLNVSSNVVMAAAGDAYSLFVTRDGTL